MRATGFGDTPRSFPSVLPEGSVTLWHASLTYLDLAIFAAALVVMALFFWMFNYTKTGRAMRAVGMNRRAAQLVGINLSRVQMLVWGLSGAISAVAAVLIAPKLLMTAEMGVVVTLAFAAAIVGGFTSLPGAVVGGLIIGITENLVGLFVSSRAINVAPFVVIMLVLIFKPPGSVRRQASGEEGMSAQPTLDRSPPELLALATGATIAGACACSWAFRGVALVTAFADRAAVLDDRIRHLHREPAAGVHGAFPRDAHRDRRGRAVFAGPCGILRPRHLHGRAPEQSHSACLCSSTSWRAASSPPSAASRSGSCLSACATSTWRSRPSPSVRRCNGCS